MADPDNASREPIPMKLNFRVPGRMPAVYAHHMMIQPGENEVTISFFEVIPPLVFDKSEEGLRALQEAGIVAECVARVVVSRGQFPGFAVAMQQVASQLASNEGEEQPNADSSRDSQEG